MSKTKLKQSQITTEKAKRTVATLPRCIGSVATVLA